MVSTSRAARATPSSTAESEGPAPPSSYEAALEELEALLQRLESGELPLDQLLVTYQRGALLLDYCRSRLTAVEGQIKLLDQGLLKNWTPE